MTIKTEVEATDDIEFLRELCIERGKVIRYLKNQLEDLEDKLRRTEADLDSCHKSNY